MSGADLADVEAVVQTIATVAVDNEKYFGDLDAVVGDGDFGYSMARGFELVLQGWDGFDGLSACGRDRRSRGPAGTRPDRGHAAGCG